jgi:hypothetical protein
MIGGRVWKFGDDINTDLILPGPVLREPAEVQMKHVFAANRPEVRFDQAMYWWRVRTSAWDRRGLPLDPYAIWDWAFCWPNRSTACS